MKNKTVQIPFKLFINCYLLLIEEGFNDINNRVYQETKKALQAKFDAILKHDLYTKYKTAETEEERENARKKYLDEIGMPKSFRYSTNFDN